MFSTAISASGCVETSGVTAASAAGATLALLFLGVAVSLGVLTTGAPTKSAAVGSTDIKNETTQTIGLNYYLLLLTKV
jgi:hypothetical protein